MRLIDTNGLSLILSSLEREMHNTLDSKLAQLGITLSQYSTLSALEQKQELTNAELARSCSVTPQTMIRIVNDLMTKSLIVTVKKQVNLKKRKLCLSPKAHQLICKAHSAVNEVEETMLKEVSIPDRKRLFRMLNACLAALGEDITR